MPPFGTCLSLRASLAVVNGTSLRALDWSSQGTFLWRLISIDGTPSSGMPRPEFRAGPPIPWNELPKKVESVLGSVLMGRSVLSASK